MRQSSNVLEAGDSASEFGERGEPLLTESTPLSPISRVPNKVSTSQFLIQLGAAYALTGLASPVFGDDSITSSPAIDFDANRFRVPYNHENVQLNQFLGRKATIIFNMKLDDPQTASQYPFLVEIYNKYAKDGLNVLSFPSEQGYFEPDDDETCRAKSKEYYGFGNYPTAVVFDKVDVLGPSAAPLYAALTTGLKTPNGYGRITLNYEKFLLNAKGLPVRRYPRKFSAYDMEPDIIALLEDRPLPDESPAFQKAWREAKREAIKSEYAFRYNYNYYTAPDSMYRYDTEKDKR
jgi:glutathione peroxidase